MAVRTDIATVRGILSATENAALTDAQITAAITAASLIVDTFASASCHTADSLKAVETYLAADIAVRTTYGGEITEEKIGDASEKRNKQVGLDKESDYMITAKMLDCSGELARKGKKSITFAPFGTA